MRARVAITLAQMKRYRPSLLRLCLGGKQKSPADSDIALARQQRKTADERSVFPRAQPDAGLTAFDAVKQCLQVRGADRYDRTIPHRRRSISCSRFRRLAGRRRVEL